MEVRNRFKGLNLIDRVPDELWNEAEQRLIEFFQENALVIANTLFQQHKRRPYTWTSPDGQLKNRLIIFFAAKDGEAHTVNKNKTRSRLWLRS